MTSRVFVALLSLLLAAGPSSAVVEAPNLDLMRQEAAIKQDTELKIQSDILDPILGKDKAKAFVDVELEVLAQKRENTKTGAGMKEAYKEKPGAKGFATQFILPGVPKPKNIAPGAAPERPAQAQGMTAAQEKGEQEEIYGLKTLVKKFGVTVIHDESLSKAKLDTCKTSIVSALSRYQLKPEQVVFRPTRFNAVRWLDDLRNPSVYIPLLYAVLLLLLLSFLWGPVASFMRKYIASIYDEKPEQKTKSQAEVDADADGKGGGGAGDEMSGKNESKLDIMYGAKAPEEPPPPPEEDEDAMKKFEPFTYINEENLKRLANLFLLRHEEPWLVAVVLSYLKPEFSKQVLSLLPVELQSKVALEALKVRQVTREQLIAIDAEVKENVDFVVGGMERFVKMLEETDPQTRNNILEYLKNDKPVLYQRVRNFILVFDDLITFPDRDMQTIVRELKTEHMAKALQGASPEAVSKFIKNMSAGAASLLKESMDFTKGLSQAQIEEERAKIMETINNLEREGKISVLRARREKGKEGFQEELAEDRRFGSLSESAKKVNLLKAAAEDLAPAAQPDPAAAQRYLQAGAQAYQAGRLDEAVTNFRAVLDIDPNAWQAYQFLGAALYQMGRHGEALMYYEKLLEFNPDPQLRAWVDGFKAQVK